MPVLSGVLRCLKYLVVKYEGKVRLVFKDFPLDISCNESLPDQLHPLGCRAAAMAHCAHARGKFWKSTTRFSGSRT